MRENKVVRVTCNGGIIGLLGDNPADLLRRATKKYNSQNFSVKQVLPDTTSNIIQLIFRIIGLIITAGFWTTANGFIIVFEREVESLPSKQEMKGVADSQQDESRWEEKIYRKGLASLKRGSVIVVGKLYLTHQRLSFKSHKSSFRPVDLEIPLKEINSVEKEREKIFGIIPYLYSHLKVINKNNDEYIFAVYGGDAWISEIKNNISFIASVKTGDEVVADN